MLPRIVSMTFITSIVFYDVKIWFSSAVWRNSAKTNPSRWTNQIPSNSVVSPLNFVLLNLRHWIFCRTILTVETRWSCWIQAESALLDSARRHLRFCAAEFWANFFPVALVWLRIDWGSLLFSISIKQEKHARNTAPNQQHRIEGWNVRDTGAEFECTWASATRTKWQRIRWLGFALARF